MTPGLPRGRFDYNLLVIVLGVAVALTISMTTPAGGDDPARHPGVAAWASLREAMDGMRCRAVRVDYFHHGGGTSVRLLDARFHWPAVYVVERRLDEESQAGDGRPVVHRHAALDAANAFIASGGHGAMPAGIVSDLASLRPTRVTAYDGMRTLMLGRDGPIHYRGMLLGGFDLRAVDGLMPYVWSSAQIAYVDQSLGLASAIRPGPQGGDASCHAFAQGRRAGWLRDDPSQLEEGPILLRRVGVDARLGVPVRIALSSVPEGHAVATWGALAQADSSLSWWGTQPEEVRRRDIALDAYTQVAGRWLPTRVRDDVSGNMRCAILDLAWEPDDVVSFDAASLDAVWSLGVPDDASVVVANVATGAVTTWTPGEAASTHIAGVPVTPHDEPDTAGTGVQPGISWLRRFHLLAAAGLALAVLLALRHRARL